MKTTTRKANGQLASRYTLAGAVDRSKSAATQAYRTTAAAQRAAKGAPATAPRRFILPRLEDSKNFAKFGFPFDRERGKDQLSGVVYVPFELAGNALAITVEVG